MIKPRISKVKTGYTTCEFTIIISNNNIIIRLKKNESTLILFFFNFKFFNSRREIINCILNLFKHALTKGISTTLVFVKAYSSIY